MTSNKLFLFLACAALGSTTLISSTAKADRPYYDHDRGSSAAIEILQRELDEEKAARASCESSKNQLERDNLRLDYENRRLRDGLNQGPTSRTFTGSKTITWQYNCNGPSDTATGLQAAAVAEAKGECGRVCGDCSESTTAPMYEVGHSGDSWTCEATATVTGHDCR